MFISDEEARVRIRSSQNVLNVIRKDKAEPSVAPVQVPSSSVPSSSIPALPSVEEVEKSLLGQTEVEDALEVPEGQALRRMLGMGILGRRPGIPDMPREVMAAVATTAQLSTIKTAAQAFDTSTHHAHELKHGYTNQVAQYGPDAPDAQILTIITRQKKEVRDLAFEKLTKALGLITDDKLLVVEDVTKLSRIARDLSGVVEKVLPKEAANVGGVHFHVWRPEMRDESTYEVIPVTAR